MHRQPRPSEVWGRIIGPQEPTQDRPQICVVVEVVETRVRIEILDDGFFDYMTYDRAIFTTQFEYLYDAPKPESVTVWDRLLRDGTDEDLEQ